MKWSVTKVDDFSVHAGGWSELHARSHHSPLLASAFVAALLTEFGAGQAWLASCEEGGRTTAMALIVRSGRFSWTTFQPAQAPVGLWLQEQGSDTIVLAQALLRALPPTALVFGLTQCDPDLMCRPADSMFVRTIDYAETARIHVAGTFADYWSGCSKNLRTNLRKQRARLHKAGRGPRLQICRGGAEMVEAVGEYATLESAGWKAGAGTAVSAGDRQYRFYRAVLCNQGDTARVFRYWIDNRLVAIDLCVEDASQLIILKTTYDQTIHPLSPALLMREEAMQSLFREARHKRIEFYGRVMDWHRQWAHEVRTLFHMNVYRWPGLARWHTKAAPC